MKESKTKFEDIINTIQLGDCYKLIKDIPNKSIDCVYIDIPYLYDMGSCGKSKLGERLGKRKMELMGCKKVYDENKNKPRAEALRIAKNIKKSSLNIISIEDGIDYSIFDEVCRVMKKINIFIWCSKLQMLDIMKYFIENKNCFFEVLVWCKSNPTPATNNSWLPDIEYCLYFREKGVTYNDGYELKSKYYVSSANVKDKDMYEHPTIKPLELVERHLKHTTQQNDIVLDCFCGSGTTCVACKNIGRRYIGIEIDNTYWQIANDRINGISQIERKIKDSGQTSIFDFVKGEREK